MEAIGTVFFALFSYTKHLLTPNVRKIGDFHIAREILPFAYSYYQPRMTYGLSYYSTREFRSGLSPPYQKLPFAFGTVWCLTLFSHGLQYSTM